MPLPAILLGASAITGAGGLTAAGIGGKKMLDAKRDLESIGAEHEENLRRFEEASGTATSAMDELGALELEVCESFERFSSMFEVIKNKPVFDDLETGNLDIPRYDPDELRKVSVEAGAIVGALQGTGLGAGASVAAAFAAKGAVAAIGVASTGTPIASLSGVAATNAIMAALGGGTIAAGGGGMALGSVVLGATTTGIGILVGGIVFALAGSSVSDNVDEAKADKDRAADRIDTICRYLSWLEDTALRYRRKLSAVYEVYKWHLGCLSGIIYGKRKTGWRYLDEEKRLTLENLVLLVSILYRMCKLNLIIQTNDGAGINSVNYEQATRQMDMADEALKEKGIF